MKPTTRPIFFCRHSRLNPFSVACNAIALQPNLQSEPRSCGPNRTARLAFTRPRSCMPDADAAWRCPRGCVPCVHFDAALRKDIVDDMLHTYGFDFKEAHRPTIIDPAPIVITAPMMIDPASPLCGRDSSIKRLVDLLVRTAVACRVHLEDTRLAAYRRLAHEIGKNISSPSRTAERVARLENELERARSAAIVRDDALRVVLAWLANELPGCWKWVQTWVPRGYKNNPLKFPHLASLHRCNRCGLQWRQVWTPNRLRRYEGAAHAERCSRPATWQLTTTKALDGELSTWLFTVLVHASPYFVLGLYCVWRVC